MNCGASHADEPDLRIRAASEKSIGGLDRILPDLIRARLDIDGSDFPFAARRKVRTDIPVINLCAASGKLLLAMSRLPDRQLSPPVPH